MKPILLVILALWFVARPAFGGTGKVLSPRLSSCTQDRCIEVQSEKALSGHLNSGDLYFTQSHLRLSVKGKEISSFEAESLYFSASAQELLIRGIKKSLATGSSSEAYYDLATGTLHLLPSLVRK